MCDAEKHGNSTNQWNVLEQELKTLYEFGEYSKMVELALETYSKDLYNFLFMFLRNLDDTSEVFCQTCSNVWESIQTFRWRSSFRAWLYCVARNTCFRFKSKNLKWKKRVQDSYLLNNRLVYKARSETRPYLKTVIKSKVMILRQQLSDEDQLVLTLRIDQNLSWRDVVDVIYGVDDERNEIDLVRKAASCRKKYERAKNRLRELVDQNNLLAEDE